MILMALGVHFLDLELTFFLVIDDVDSEFS